MTTTKSGSSKLPYTNFPCPYMSTFSVISAGKRRSQVTEHRCHHTPSDSARTHEETASLGPVVLWVDEIHFAPPKKTTKMSRFPCKYQQRMVSTMVSWVTQNGFGPSSRSSRWELLTHPETAQRRWGGAMASSSLVRPSAREASCPKRRDLLRGLYSWTNEQAVRGYGAGIWGGSLGAISHVKLIQTSSRCIVNGGILNLTLKGNPFPHKKGKRGATGQLGFGLKPILHHPYREATKSLRKGKNKGVAEFRDPKFHRSDP